MKKLKIINILLAVTLGAFATWAIITYFHLSENLYTNDAQVEEYINPVNTRIPGYIKEVRFTEHQQIKKGDTLVLIDDREYRIAVAQAEAALLAAKAARRVTSTNISTVGSNLGVTDANISASRARLWNAEQNYHRFENLLKEGAVTQAQFDQVKTEYNALKDQTEALLQQRNTVSLSTSESTQKVAVNDAEIKRAQAALDMAQLNLSYTVITAPYDGITGRRNIQEGQLLQTGQNLLNFVRNDSKWIVANYKETQVARLAIGQRMRLKIDGLDGRVFYGHVTAIAEATGSRFSSVPTDNAAGNFIKVQQRVPVKIEFVKDEKTDISTLKLVRAGMNAEVQVVL